MPLALKIDVDTYRGLAEGADRLAVFLRAKKIPASIFVTLGPDNSGWAALRAFRQPGFLSKMRRTQALSLYGWRTALSGTLWPARPMAASFRSLLRHWKAEGFEVSPHGYDHVAWHDQAAGWSAERATQEWIKIAKLYADIFGEAPRSFAAPGWQAGFGVWQALENAGLLYHSDSRGTAPYFPATENAVFQTLEIPTTLPTWDELLGGSDLSDLMGETVKRIDSAAFHVWTIHAEVEGGPYFELFKKTIEVLAARGETWEDLREVAARRLERRAAVAVCAFTQTPRPGRAGTVTCQSRELASPAGSRFGHAQENQARA